MGCVTCDGVVSDADWAWGFRRCPACRLDAVYQARSAGNLSVPDDDDCDTPVVVDG